MRRDSPGCGGSARWHAFPIRHGRNQTTLARLHRAARDSGDHRGSIVAVVSPLRWQEKAGAGRAAQPSSAVPDEWSPAVLNLQDR